MPIDLEDVAKLPRGIRRAYEQSPERFERTAKRYLMRSGLLAANNAQSGCAAQLSSGFGGRKHNSHSAIAITPRPAPTYGVGSEMKKLLMELDIPHAWCETCAKRAATMDANGPQWCRDNRSTIIGWLTEAEAKFAHDAAAATRGDGKEPTAQQIAQAKQAQRWKTGWAAARQLMWINPVDPFGSFVDEAVRRAEAAS